MNNLRGPDQTREAAGNRWPAAARAGAWFLALSPLGFVIYTAFGLVFFVAAGVSLWSEIDRDLMTSLRLGWVIGQFVFVLPYLLGTVGVFCLARELLHTRARRLALATIVSAGAALLGAVAYATLMILAGGFTEGRMGLNVYGQLATGPVVQFAADPSAWSTALFLGMTFWRAEIRPTLGLVVAILAALAIVATVVAGSAPPFAVSFLWLALGIGWFKSARQRGTTGQPLLPRRTTTIIQS